MKISPSLLAAPLTKISESVKKIEHPEVDYLHLDVMDGHFVPQITFGEAICTEIAKDCKVQLDIHLMVSNPEKEVPKYFSLKPSFLTFHYEATSFPIRLAQSIRANGIGAGLALNPVTPIEAIIDLIPYFDMFLIMSIEPGFYGQSFLEVTWKRMREFSKHRDAYQKESGKKVYLQVDGGVTDQNIRELKNVGVEIAVAGSFVFKAENPVERVQQLKAKCL